MATIGSRPDAPLIVIAGPTASGKTGVGIRLAKRFDGEIISADSRAIYTGMDIGAAKPTLAERDGVPHWGFDLVTPNERFTAVDFKRYATEKIADIRRRNKVPFLVGGTGLYIDALLFDYQFGSDGSSQTRQHYETWGIEALQRYCIKNNIELPNNVHNARHLIRAIEQKGINHQRSQQPISTSIIVGIATERTQREHNISQRAEQLFENGVVEEAIMLGKKYGWNSEAMTGNIYPLVRRYVNNELTHDQLVKEFIKSDLRLAKRQMTWLRRNPYMLWATVQEAEHYLAAQLDVL